MKKILLASVAVAALTAGIAQAHESFTGFNFGTQGGLSLNKFKLDGLHQDKTGGTIGIFTGYGYEFDNHLYLGGELEGNLFTGKAAKKDPTGDIIKSKAKNDIGANLRLGYVFDHGYLGYVIAGINSTDVEVRDGDQSNAGANPLKKSKRLNGAKVGAGLDAILTNNIFARGEYNYKVTEKKTILPGSKTKLQQHNVRFGLGMII